MVKIEFTTSGASFCNDYTGEPDEYSERMEINRMLEKIIVEIEHGYSRGSVMDYNGNLIGHWEI